VSDYIGNRLSGRAACKLRVKIRGKKLKEKQYHTANISSGGLFISSKKAPELNMKVDIKLYLPYSKKPIEITGKILRIKWSGEFKKIEGFALEFKKMSREAEDRLHGYLNKLKAEDF
jgi:Tfp pilus assembly protein PilZ